MNYLIALLSFASFSLSASAPQMLLVAPNARMQEDPKSIIINGTHFKTVIVKAPCNGPVLRYLKHDLETLSAKSFSLKSPGTLEVSVLQQKKTIAPGSPLGRFIENFDQKMITLQKEVKLACRKK